MSADGRQRPGPLAERVRSGDPAALARALSRAENGDETLMQALRPAAGSATVVGFTGPPGAGKSTLINALIRDWRDAGRRIAVLAVDPVSPLSGGAVLGDRTRMGEHSMDRDVFIRSVSARGHLGGLSSATHDMIDVMDAAGWGLILLETVGSGQSETEVSELADIRVVVAAPGLGDEVQAIKAGILEIADILVVNKADHADAARTARDLAAMVELRSAMAPDVPVLQTCATTSKGIDSLRRKIEKAAAAPGTDRHARRLAALKLRLADILARRLRSAIEDDPALDPLIAEVAAGRRGMDDALGAVMEKVRFLPDGQD
ncbi:MAG: methylmalonyl Co-A mutase-associated GTPase MeaB [Pseudomonadota bacterium]